LTYRNKSVPSKIAAYLRLAKKYTGHCLRRTAATLHSDAGSSSDSLMRLGGWKGASVTREYVDDSDSSKKTNASLVAGNVVATITTTTSNTISTLKNSAY